MVGRALVGQVESYFEPQLLRARHQLLEIFKRPQLRIDGLVPAFRGSDRPGTAHVIGRGVFGIVLALAIHPADGMNRGKIDNVETHARRRSPVAWMQSCRVPCRPGCGEAGTRKHFIPGAEAGLFAIDDDSQFPAVGGCPAAIRISDHQSFQLRARRLLDRLRACRCGQLSYLFGCGRRGQPCPSALARSAAASISWTPVRMSTDRSCAASNFFHQIAAPGLKAIDPGLQGVEMPALGGDTGTLPASDRCSARLHGNFFPIGLERRAVAQDGVQNIVAVGEDVSGDVYAITDGALDGETSAIDLRLDVLDDDSAGDGRLDGARFLRPSFARTDLPALSSRPLVERQARCIKDPSA